MLRMTFFKTTGSSRKNDKSKPFFAQKIGFLSCLGKIILSETERPLLRVSEAEVRAENHIGDASFYGCLGVILVDLDALEDKFLA